MHTKQIAKQLKETKKIALYIDHHIKNVKLAALKLAKEFETKLSQPADHINIHDMDQRYAKEGVKYYLNDFRSKKGFKQILATGAVPVDENIKTKLVIMEQMYPRLSKTYGGHKYIDEVWYIDIQSVAAGNTMMNIMSRVVPGFDVGGEYDRGERPYSRFGIVGPDQNPERKAIVSPEPLIEIFDEFVVSIQAPVYVNNELVGKISIHDNLIFLRRDTINKSRSNLFLISDELVLIGMSPSAKAITGFTEYEKTQWDSKKAKMVYVDNVLNLEKQNKDFADKLSSLPVGGFSEWDFLGKKYQIFAEDIQEAGFRLVALL